MSDSPLIANAFNEYCSTVGNQFAEKLKYVEVFNPVYQIDIAGQSMYLFNWSFFEVINVITSLKSKKHQIDEISNVFLLKSRFAIAPYLT